VFSWSYFPFILFKAFFCAQFLSLRLFLFPLRSKSDQLAGLLGFPLSAALAVRRRLAPKMGFFSRRGVCFFFFVHLIDTCPVSFPRSFSPAYGDLGVSKPRKILSPSEIPFHLCLDRDLSVLPILLLSFLPIWHFPPVTWGLFNTTAARFCPPGSPTSPPLICPLSRFPCSARTPLAGMLSRPASSLFVAGPRPTPKVQINPFQFRDFPLDQFTRSFGSRRLSEDAICYPVMASQFSSLSISPHFFSFPFPASFENPIYLWFQLMIALLSF